MALDFISLGHESTVRKNQVTSFATLVDESRLFKIG